MEAEKRKFYTFTNDLMFSLVMRNEEICRGILTLILPEEDIGEIKIIEPDNSFFAEENNIEDGNLEVETQKTFCFDPTAHGVGLMCLSNPKTHGLKSRCR